MSSRYWIGFGVLVVLVGNAVLIAVESPWAGATTYGFWFIVLAGLLVRALSSRRAGLSATTNPATSAVGEYEHLYLGRPRIPVTYGSEPGVVAEAQAEIHDPLSDPVWTIEPAPTTDAAPRDPRQRADL